MKLLDSIIILIIMAAFFAVVVYHQNESKDSFLPSPEQEKIEGPLIPPYSSHLFIFSILLLSFIVRVLLIRYHVQTPFNAFIVMVGFIWGIVCYNNQKIRLMSKLVVVQPEEILHLYVPVLVFGTAFSMDNTIFKKTLAQSLVVGLPVSLLTAALFGLMARYVISTTWSRPLSIFFGTLCIPINPQKLTHLLLQQTAQTKQMTMMLDSEFLVTLLIVDIVREIVRSVSLKMIIYEYQIVCVLLRFLIMGILMGYLGGCIGRILIRKMSTERVQVFAICVLISFFTFSMSETHISGCGTISVWIVGYMLRSECAILSRDVEKFLLDFWKLARRFLEAIICVRCSAFAAMYITSSIDWKDYVLVFATYLLYYITRFFNFLLFSPIINRLGFGMKIKNMIVCAWCGLKSPYSLEIVGAIRESGELTQDIANKMCFYILGIYFLSLIVNATFTETLMDFLELNQISLARQVNMNNCMKHVLDKKERIIRILKMDRFLNDCDWPFVVEATAMTHPYKMGLETEDEDSFFEGYRFTYCKDCKKEVLQTPTAKEMKEMAKEGRTRLLKAKKICYLRQFENGMLSKEGFRVQNQLVELGMDADDTTIGAKDLQRRFREAGCFERFVRKRADKLAQKKKQKLRPPRTYWRRLCYHVITKPRFDKIMICIVAVNLIFIILDMVYHHSIVYTPEALTHDEWLDYVLLVSKAFFFGCYLAECIIKIMGYSWIYVWSHGVKTYFKSFWNIIDFIVLVGLLLDLIETGRDVVARSHITEQAYFHNLYQQIIDLLNVFRVLKLLLIFQVFYPDIIQCLDKQTDTRMAFTYELGKSYVTGGAEILLMLPYMIDNETIREELQHRIENDKITITKLLSLVQKERPWIAITVKTKQAIWTIFNSINEAINQLKAAGWVDTYELIRLTTAVSDLHAKVNEINKVLPSPPKVIFKEVAWMAADEAVIDFLFENVTVQTFDPDQRIFVEGDMADGIYIVVTGLFMITYQPDDELIENLEELGQLPIVDYIAGTKFDEPSADYIVSGNCIGELGVLTGRPYNCTITAEVPSQVYVLSRGVLKRAMELSSNPITGLQCRIWKDVGVRVAVTLLLATPAYQNVTQDQVKYALERAFVPDLSSFKIFSVNDTIEDVVLIEGVAADFNTREVFTAPCCIPRTVQKLIMPKSSLMNIPVNIETKLLIIPEKDADEIDVMMVAEETCELVTGSSWTTCLQHTVRNRSKNRRLLNKARGLVGSHSRDSRGRRVEGVASLGTKASTFASEASESFYFKSVKSEGHSSINIEHVEEKSAEGAVQGNISSPPPEFTKRKSLFFF